MVLTGPQSPDQSPANKQDNFGGADQSNETALGLDYAEQVPAETDAKIQALKEKIDILMTSGLEEGELIAELKNVIIALENTEQENTEQENTEQENTEQENTEQENTEQENTEQESTEQENTEQENTEQESTEQKKTYTFLTESLTDASGKITFGWDRRGRLSISLEKNGAKTHGNLNIKKYITDLEAGKEITIPSKTFQRDFVLRLVDGQLAISSVLFANSTAKNNEDIKKNIEENKLKPKSNPEVYSEELLIDKMTGINQELQSSDWAIKEHWEIDSAHAQKRFGLRKGDLLKGVVKINRKDEGTARFDDSFDINFRDIVVGDTTPQRVDFKRWETNSQYNPLKRKRVRDHLFVSFSLDEDDKLTLTLSPSKELKQYYSPEKETTKQELDSVQTIDGREVHTIDMAIPALYVSGKSRAVIPSLALTKADPVNNKIVKLWIQDHIFGRKSSDTIGYISRENGKIGIQPELGESIRDGIVLRHRIEDGVLTFRWYTEKQRENRQKKKEAKKKEAKKKKEEEKKEEEKTKKKEEEKKKNESTEDKDKKKTTKELNQEEKDAVKRIQGTKLIEGIPLGSYVITAIAKFVPILSGKINERLGVHVNGNTLEFYDQKAGLNLGKPEFVIDISDLDAGFRDFDEISGVTTTPVRLRWEVVEDGKLNFWWDEEFAQNNSEQPETTEDENELPTGRNRRKWFL